ncbi:acylphosphatase [Diaphorobacter sp.]|uniref:acylphosphatase n=1 Tax=Diaphorobacter sp. TaxID=1934310 RepID=UPI0025861176|nr:acylphosphatase [Diaphorobacter sp.]
MAESAASITRHLRIHGLVQGVYYRKSMTEAACRLGVQGWVRNRQDGTVEALASGAAPALQALIDWAHEGPPAARVERVEVAQAPACDAQGFEQRETV